MPLPSEKEEVWRYSPVDQLDLDDYRPVAPPAGDRIDDPLATAFVDGVVADVPDRAALIVAHNGRPVAIDRGELPGSIVVGDLAAGAGHTGGADSVGGVAGAGEALGRVLSGGDAFVRLNDAFLPGVLSIDVPSGVVVDRPIVVVHWCGPDPSGGGAAPAVFPRTVVRVGDRAQAGVVEIVAGVPGQQPALVVPVVELSADDGADLAYVSLQVLGTGAWHIGRVAARAGRDATVRSFTVGLGSAYDRSRTDATAAGPGARSELRSAYLGIGEQVHDVRTLQDHAAPHTTSDLLCQGAVAGRSRSVYSGLIRVRRGAVRTVALQTNHNLVLDERAHADSVPNLDIEENDVRCSHASTVGPIDEDQRYYLESRGIAPDRAERLIVLGFFDDIVERSPVPAVVGRLRREVGLRLADALAPDHNTLDDLAPDDGAPDDEAPDDRPPEGVPADG
ncbi:MAG TPA: SufD family Fe-S cluster assembly protein [Acidimicrobiales bacterium]|nr:SufD family Fe-S cluster assembly protein [Acidimicrobiales bacterium]